MRRATKTRSFSFPDAIWRRFWSPRRAIRLSRALFLASRHALWDSPGAPGASRGRHETLPRHLLNALGRHGVPQKAPRIDFRSSAWRRPHRLTNSLISCEPADTVESPCGPAHTKQGCLSIRVACAYPNAHGRASSTLPGSIFIDFRVDFRVAFASGACLFCRLSLHTLSAQPARLPSLTFLSILARLLLLTFRRGPLSVQFLGTARVRSDVLWCMNVRAVEHTRYKLYKI